MTCTRCQKELEAESVYCRFCGAEVRAADPAQRLSRIPNEGRVAGVCAGLAAYLDVDVTLVRLAWVILSVVPGVLIGGLVAYAVAWVFLPITDPRPDRTPSGKRLIRSAVDTRIAGVCGGVAEYFGVDSTIVRLVFVVLTIYPGAVIGGVVTYLIAWFIIPAPSGAQHSIPTTA